MVSSKVRPDQWIGLVEDRQRVERAVLHQPLDGQLVAIDVALDEHPGRRGVAKLAHVGGRENLGNTRQRGPQLCRRIGADDTAAAGEHERLDDARKGDAVRHRRCLGVHRDGPGRGQPGGALRGAEQALVAAGTSAGHRVPWQAEFASHHRRQYRRTVTHGEHAVEPVAEGSNDGGKGARFVVESNRDGAVAPGILEAVAAIGRQHQLDAQSPGGLVEHPRLIAGRRRAQEQARARRDIGHRV